MGLGLREGEASVVEDRGAENGVGARVEGLGEVLELARPPEAITGTLTASLTAAVRGRS